ncbi:MAG: hypothetical protein QXG66_01800 [Candidatus Bathyarchaeia archaeon]
MTRPDRGKTRTIKDRAVYVYLPSVEMVEDWRRRAEKAGVSISRFVVECVEDSIRREEGEEGYLSRAELVKRLRSAEEKLKSLREENRLLKRLVENLDNELKRYRARKSFFCITGAHPATMNFQPFFKELCQKPFTILVA